MNVNRRFGPDAPPAIVLGGELNAISVARSLSKAGVVVHAINLPSERIRYSRHCRWISLPGSGGPEEWEAFLCGRSSDSLRGAVLLTCSDTAIDLLIRRQETLRERFVIEEADATLRQSLLDKLTTYRLADAAGVPTPQWRTLGSLAELESVKSELRFPVILKPRLSHRFTRVWSKLKYLRADDIGEARRWLSQATDKGIEVVLMEFIPGGDEQGCSYYAYMGADGEPVAELTKRCIRRFRPNMGGECFGRTDWVPDARELGLRFFRHVGLRGVGHIEFKRDQRNGNLKIIECNARFTGANCVVKAGGVDLAVVAYSVLTGAPPPVVRQLPNSVCWWNPSDDFLAFLALRREGKITIAQWLSQVLKPHALPCFEWSDPLPSIVGGSRRLVRAITQPKPPAVVTAPVLAPRGGRA